MEECFAKLLNGDKSAFEYIYKELKTPVYTIIYRIVQSRELAEDIMQDVFVKIYSAPPAQEVKNLRAWVFSIAHNAAIDALRKQREHCDIDETEQNGSVNDLAQSMDIEKALSSLPCEEREILSLHLNAGLGFAEIADIMSLSLSAVYRRYRRALKTMKNLLEVSV